jgi:hypothetical protein
VSDDPIIRLARNSALRAIQDSADIEAQLSIQSGTRPILSVLIKAREKAAVALTALAFCDENNPDSIRKLQNEVRRYDDLVMFFRDIVTAGFEEDDAIQESDRDEMAELLSPFAEGTRDAGIYDDAEDTHDA